MQVDIALEPVYNADQLAELAVLAEQSGVATIWVTNDPLGRDLFMLFSKAAAMTSRIRLGVMAVSPFEFHPVKLAASLHTLNEMSHGRASVIVGGGGAIMAYTKIDVSRRVRAVGECIDILRHPQPGEPLNYPGEIYPVWRFSLSWANPSSPRVLAGANRNQMLRMGARSADGVHMSDMPLQKMQATLQTISESLAKHGRELHNFEINNFWAFHVKPELAAARREARSRLILRGMLRRFYTETILEPAEIDQVEANLDSFYSALHKQDGVIDKVPPPIVEKLIDNLTLTSSVADMDRHLAHIHEFAAAGLTHVTLGLHDEPADLITLIGKRVLPAVT